jgi:hypothetical protein
LSDFNKNFIILTNFSRTVQYKISCENPVSHTQVLMYRQTDLAKPLGTFLQLLFAKGAEKNRH